MIINGLQGDSINANDRGLMYGDGVFRTLRIRLGQPLFWPQHYLKLQHDCAALDIECPPYQLLDSELMPLAENCVDGIAKIIITRGAAYRGYAPSVNAPITRIIAINSLPNYPDSYATLGIKAHICALRMGHQPRFAGIKHLNRLENVLAAAEWHDPKIAEGIMLDMDSNIVEGTRSNLFLLSDAKLYTPDLSRCGVAGLQRDRVISYARQQGIECKILDLQMADLLAADEVFIVNSVIGLWPVSEMPGFNRVNFPISLQIQEWLNNASN